MNMRPIGGGYKLIDFVLGLSKLTLADANAAHSDEEHQSALYNILRNFGDVRMSDDLITVLDRGSSA